MGGVMKRKPNISDKVLLGAAIILACLALILLVYLSIAALTPSQEIVSVENVTINETWAEDTYYNGKWFIVSLIIGETNQRQFQFRSIDSADAWLKSLLASPKYDVTVRDWFYVHGKE
jgi:hypothetical protein